MTECVQTWVAHCCVRPLLPSMAPLMAPMRALVWRALMAASIALAARAQLDDGECRAGSEPPRCWCGRLQQRGGERGGAAECRRAPAGLRRRRAAASRCWWWSGGQAPAVEGTTTEPLLSGRRPAAAAALLLLRDSIENWPEFSAANNITGWNASFPVCFWTGIVCSGDARVQQVSLQCGAGCGVPAVGTLPPAFGDITVLSTFNLQGNAFRGRLPPEWGHPQKLTLLQNL